VVAQPQTSAVEVGAQAAGGVSEQQQLIAQLQAQLAALQQQVNPAQPVAQQVQSSPQRTVLIHFLEDGYTALSTIWYRGQELELTVGSPQWLETCDREGRSWLEMAGDDGAQMRRWGRVMFRPGPWPGKTLKEAAKEARFQSLLDENGQPVRQPSEEEFERAYQAELRRKRAAPRVPANV
jgi:hypothetical protein